MMDMTKLESRRTKLVIGNRDDWLLAEYARFDGRRGSLERLWRMRDCAFYARTLNESGTGQRVSGEVSRDWVKVTIEGKDESTTWSVSRNYPFVGLKPLYDRLKEKALPYLAEPA